MKKLITTLAAVGTALFILFGIPAVTQVTVPAVEADSDTYVVDVATSYLALRNAKAYDYYNEIGKLWRGDTVQVLSYDSGTYWYVYAPTLGKSGYVNKNYLKSSTPSGETYTVSVASGYLALRTAKAYDYSNEIGKLYSGQTVTVQDKSDSTYWWVYAPTLGKSGYVNRNYLLGAAPAPAPAPSGETYTVSVASGYLALRTAKAYDYSNEIGKLYSGQTVTVTDKSDSTYWWVYAPTLGKSGYVNRNYLLGAGGTPSPGFTKTVSVPKNYLALRSAKAFDYYNEIGKLYTGDTVQVQDTSDGTYWWVYAPSLGKSGYVNKNYLV